MTKIFVRFSDDYADEFDAEGFTIFDTIEEWNKIVEGMPEECIEASFGTNEYVSYDSKEDYLSAFVVKEITDDEAKFIISLFGNDNFGQFPIDSENY